MPVNDLYKTDVWNEFQGDVDNQWTFISKVITDAPGVLGNEEDLNSHFAATVDLLLIQMALTFEFTCIDTKKIYVATTNKKTPGIPHQLGLTGKAGTSMGGALPSQCQFCVQELSDIDDGNPSKRGRSFYNGFNVDDQTDGDWDSIPVTVFAAVLVTQLMGGFTGPNGGDYTWVGISSKAFDLDPIPAGFTFDINILRGLKQVRTQRKRQPLNPCDRYFAQQKPT